MKARYRVIADIPTWHDMGPTPAVFSKGDIVESRSYEDAADNVDSDGDVYVRDIDRPDSRVGYIQFSQLEPVAATPSPVADDLFSGAQLAYAAERLGLTKELDRIVVVVYALREVESVVEEVKGHA